MNGFVYYTGSRHSQCPIPERIAPTGEGCSFDLKHFGAGDNLLTWGHACGDIWHAKQDMKGGKKILLLSGYIAEIESGPRIESQEEAASYLLAQFIAANSDKDIEKLLKRIYGSFGIVYRDQASDITICATDRVASRPLWRSWQRSGWVISSHTTAIALSMQSLSFDLAGLGAFMLYGGPVVPTRSLYNGVIGIPPGSIFRFDNQGEYISHRWYQFRHQEDKTLSIADWSRSVADKLVKAAERIGRHCRKPAIFFSGGTDSRLAASAMKSSGINPLLVTMGDSTNLEVRVSQLASKALGLDQIVVIRDRYWYLRGLPYSIYETGGNYIWTHGHFSAAATKLINAHGADVFLLGDLCEAFSKLFCSLGRQITGVWEPEEFLEQFDRIRLPLYRPYERESTLALFNATARNEIEDALRSDIGQRFREVRSLARDPLIVGDLCFRWESVNSLPTFFMFLDLRRVAAERNLMFDRDVHLLLERLPSKMRDGNNLGAKVINQLCPSAAWVMNSNSLMPMTFPPAVHKLSKGIKPVLGKIRRNIIGKSHRTTGSWPESAVLYASDPTWRGCFDKNIVDEDLFDAKIFDLSAVRQRWADFASGRKNNSSDIEKLLQLGLSNRLLANGATDFIHENLEITQSL